MKIVEVARRAGLDRGTFEREHMDGGGLPVILTDVVRQWPAFEKWTWTYLESAFGDDLVPLATRLSGAEVKVTKLSAFLGHLQHASADVPGFWVDQASGKPVEGPGTGTAAYYLLGWFAFQRHPKLLDDIEPLPACIDDWELALTPRARDMVRAVSGRETTSLYVGAPGTVSELHQDFWGTHGWLAQVRGHKSVFLFAPGTAFEGEARDFDPDQPLPVAGNATAHHAVLAPGELLFMPSRWWHWAKGLDATITVSHNFFNRLNASEHFEELARRAARSAAP